MHGWPEPVGDVSLVVARGEPAIWLDVGIVVFDPGIPEDPATGSACAALTAFLGNLDGRSQAFEIHQGDDMGRPSLIRTSVDIDAGEVRVAGTAVRVMEGRLTL